MSEMEAVKEGEAPAVEEPTPTAEEPTKPVKEKKPKAPKEKKPKQSKTASHPPYFQMIKEAILALNEKSGSSPYAIAKYMEEKHKTELPGNFKKILALQLKNSVARGKLIKIKASYKLSLTGEKGKETTTPKPKPKPEPESKSTSKSKPATRRRTKSVNKVEAPKKKAAAGAGAKSKRKVAAAKPKQPKSIKYPAAKRAKKA